MGYQLSAVSLILHFYFFGRRNILRLYLFVFFLEHHETWADACGKRGYERAA